MSHHHLYEKKPSVGPSYTYNPMKIDTNNGPIFKIEYCRNKYDGVA